MKYFLMNWIKKYIFIKNSSANMIELKEQIKKIGDYVVIINLHADVQASIKVKVVSVEKIV